METAAYEQVLRIVRWAQLNAETYLFTAGDLREITEILSKAGLNDRGAQLLDYCHVKTYYEHETIFSSGDYKSGQQKRGSLLCSQGQAAPVLPRQPVRKDQAFQRAAEGSGSVCP